MIYIFDIDGTLADLSHRLHFIQQEPQDWRGFFAACPQDEPIKDVLLLAWTLGDSGAHLVMVSGRSDEIRAETEAWLRHYKVRYKGLYMRKSGDHRQDSIVKAELLDRVLKDRPADEPIGGVFEDRQQVVDMYRARGLRVFQVADGKF